MNKYWLKLLKAIGLLTPWMKFRGWEPDTNFHDLHYHKGTRLVYWRDI